MEGSRDQEKKEEIERPRCESQRRSKERKRVTRRLGRKEGKRADGRATAATRSSLVGSLSISKVSSAASSRVGGSKLVRLVSAGKGGRKLSVGSKAERTERGGGVDSRFLRQ